MPCVLLCDDAVAFSILFERWMSRCGVDVVGPARTADEALAMAVEHRPEVIVLDHLLPDATSAGLLPRLRKATPEAKVLLISGMPSDRLAQAAQEAGAHAYLSKAATADDMCGAVRALLF